MVVGARKLRGLRDDGFNFHCQVGVKFSVRRMRKEGDKGRKQKRADKDSSGPRPGGWRRMARLETELPWQLSAA